MLLNEMHVQQEIRDREREIRKRSRDDRHDRQLASPSIRRAVGRSIMEIGARLASEPQTSRSQTESALRLARSR
jgi:hypothetical protein